MVEPEPDEKPVGWTRVGVDGFQFGLGSTRARFLFLGVEPGQTLNPAQPARVAPLLGVRPETN